MAFFSDVCVIIGYEDTMFTAMPVKDQCGPKIEIAISTEPEEDTQLIRLTYEEAVKLGQWLVKMTTPPGFV